jgi:hypothetical protein
MQEGLCRNRDVVEKIINLLDSADQDVQLNCVNIIAILVHTEGKLFATSKLFFSLPFHLSQ